LSGCGSDSTTEPDPYVAPPPPVATFPSQVAKPSSSVVNDNGSLVLAENGLSLYTFDNDSMNTSNCAGTPEDTTTCAGKWPPLLAADGAMADSEMTIITRSDGKKQWALMGQPLYNWYQDTAQGDVNGESIFK
jgi:predicted lipoprotein with Yx(FWY)xxD motif